MAQPLIPSELKDHARYVREVGRRPEPSTAQRELLAHAAPLAEHVLGPEAGWAVVVGRGPGSALELAATIQTARARRDRMVLDLLVDHVDGMAGLDGAVSEQQIQDAAGAAAAVLVDWARAESLLTRFDIHETILPVTAVHLS